MSRQPVILAYGRSAICKGLKGSFAKAKMHPIDYSAQVLDGVVKKVEGLDPADVEDLITSCAVQHYRTSMNISRSIVLRSQVLPESVAGQTINRFCSGGLQAIATAHNAILANQGDIMIGGGVEDMTGTFEPYPEEYQDQWLNAHDKNAYIANGITAENIVKKYGITREQMDELAVESHRKAYAAQQAGELAKSIIPVVLEDPSGTPILDENGKQILVTEDEGIRPTTNMESLAKLKTCFIPEDQGGTVTAATSSQVSDAASFVLLAEEEKAKAIGAKPIAKLISFAVAGLDPAYMGLGPIYAAPKALKRAGLTMDDMDVVELNEAFAAQVIPCVNELGIDMNKLNPWGGAMALGHPLGCTGAFLTCKVLDYLQEKGGKYGMVTMCIGGGMGACGIYEML